MSVDRADDSLCRFLIVLLIHRAVCQVLVLAHPFAANASANPALIQSFAGAHTKPHNPPPPPPPPPAPPVPPSAGAHPPPPPPPRGRGVSRGGGLFFVGYPPAKDW